VTYLNGIERQRLLFHNLVLGFQRARSLDSPMLRLLNVRYLLTAWRIRHPDWELVYEGRMRIYRSRREMPRAFMVHRAEAVRSLEEAVQRLRSRKVDPEKVALVEVEPERVSQLGLVDDGRRGAVRVVRYSHTVVELETNSSTRGLVVLCDVMYPGWRAYLDGRETAILRVDGIFRGAVVPAGRHRLAFRFEPSSLRRGWLLLEIALAMMLGAGLWWWLGRRSPAKE